jgi:hypothetical protein
MNFELLKFFSAVHVYAFKSNICISLYSQEISMNILPELSDGLNLLLDALVKSSFVIEKQPPQVYSILFLFEVLWGIVRPSIWGRFVTKLVGAFRPEDVEGTDCHGDA